MNKKQIIIIFSVSILILTTLLFYVADRPEKRADLSQPQLSLKDHIKSLSVYRLWNDGEREDAKFFSRAKKSAHTMHESTRYPDEGWVKDAWVIGSNDWDTVGLTKQRSGGRPRFGLWAHPKDGTLLVIENDNVMIGETLSGFAGLTDYANMRARSMRVSEPINFKIYLDNTLIYENSFKRITGWHDFDIPLDDEVKNKTHKLKIIINSSKERWAHFIFDLRGSSEK